MRKSKRRDGRFGLCKCILMLANVSMTLEGPILPYFKVRNEKLNWFVFKLMTGGGQDGWDG